MITVIGNESKLSDGSKVFDLVFYTDGSEKTRQRITLEMEDESKAIILQRALEDGVVAVYVDR